jgi:tRNA/tmRNA/rRNA uracil-C5-methylase (TrmA/RlmC/RlmD family)
MRESDPVGLGDDQVETVESLETLESGDGYRIALWNRTRDEIVGNSESVEVGDGAESFSVSVRSFFQVNRFRCFDLQREVERRAREIAGESALDAYSGVGFFSSGLARAGYRVTSVESSRFSVADARRNRERLDRPENVRIVGARLEDYLAGSDEAFDVVLADPPRAGLGRSAAELAARARRALLYVSCDPASLARDLRAMLPLGFEVAAASLEDFFPLTHRVEAMIDLRRIP